METEELAKRFVDIVTANRSRWNVKDVQLPSEEINVLTEVVLAAGFAVEKLVKQQVVGHYCDQDGSRLSDTYVANRSCPYVVVGPDPEDYFPTGWLDSLVEAVTRSYFTPSNSMKIVIREIRRSVPLEPIQLRPAPDSFILREDRPRPTGQHFGQYLVDHVRNYSPLKGRVGVHSFCGGNIVRVGAAPELHALVCSNCFLRVLIPAWIQTYVQLREYAKTVLVPT